VYDLPSYTWALVLAGTLGIPAATCIVLYRGGVAAGLDRGAAAGIVAATAAVLGAWLVITSALARALVYQGPEGGLWFGVAFGGVLATLLLGTRIPAVSRTLAAPGTAARLALPHTLRVVGAVFVLLMAQGHLPAAFALPAGLGDIAIGIAAPFVARRLAREPDGAGAVAAAVRFNWFGLLDLVIAVTLGVLLGLPGLLAVTPSTEPLRLLPLALIPTAAVPLAIALHVVALRRLHTVSARADASSATTRRPTSRPEPARP
jgi:hypothetical protein